MTAPPGSARLASTTVRPAEKGATSQGLDGAQVRRLIDGLVAVTGMRRKKARAIVLAHVSKGGGLDGWSHWLRNNWGISDPTGEAATRAADRRGA